MINGQAVREPQRNVALRAGVHAMVLHQPPGQPAREHAHPAWSVVVPRAGHLVWTAGHTPARSTAGVIFPPQVSHCAGSAAGHVSVLIDAWYLGLGPGHGRAIPLEVPAAAHVRALWSPENASDLDMRARQTVAFLRQQCVLPRAVSIDPRVVVALRDLAAAECVDDVAASVGLSPSRLRALIRGQTGTPPARLRMWLRLRAAILTLPNQPIALAAFDAGFADQAHLTRTATRFVGQTPGELARCGMRNKLVDERTRTFARAA